MDFKPIMALDLGMCTLGIATSSSGHMATPLANLHFPNGSFEGCYDKVIGFVRDHFIGLIVMGRPCYPSGDSSPMTQVATDFAQELDTRLKAKGMNIPMVFQDEQYSTLEAAALMHGDNIRSKKQKPKIDQVAACVILERYLRSAGYEVW